ncbi:MAG: TorF family putative porin, partial [Pseudomonadales bacterium]
MHTLKRLMTVMLIASAGLSATQANADVSYNIGYASEYYFRGILQKESSGSAGIDFEQGGLYLGTWAADVGDGLEVDLYGGYGIETES